MKKIVTLILFVVFAYTANAQQIIPASKLMMQTSPVKPMFSNNLSTAIIDVNQIIADINRDFYLYSGNYSKLYKSSLLNSDSKDRFADFYEAYNYSFNNNITNATPMIRNMPPPGPYLDYHNINTCGPGLYDKAVKQ